VYRIKDLTKLLEKFENCNKICKENYENEKEINENKYRILKHLIIINYKMSKILSKLWKVRILNFWSINKILYIL